ncbi:MAG: HRDC domain-containing protein [Verrucomicrobiales bacterium]|nr:HRDC domain-containing protein [Verrucomicrobiales bacterium]
MAYAFFRIGIGSTPDGAEPLNRFLRSHRVVGVRREFISDGENSCWAFSVEYLDGESPADRSRDGRIDYRETLPPEQFAVFARLRVLRKELADRDGLPAFGVFTNEQLVQMVQMTTKDLASLKKIPGVGAGKIEKYGTDFLAALNPPLPQES